MVSDELLEELGTLLGHCVNVIRELEVENAELKVRREWVGLTDTEIKDITTHVYDTPPTLDDLEFARLVSESLQEKNCDL